MASQEYLAKDITVMEGLEAVRKKFDVVELSKKIKQKGDVLILSSQLKIKPRILNSAYYERRILSTFPYIDRSKASALAPLRTNRDLIRFAERYNLDNLQVRDIVFLVRKWNNEIQKNPLLLISSDEHEMIIGTLMGDGSIRKRDKNSSIRFSHSIKQKNYCEEKKNILKEFNLSEFNEKQTKNNYRQIHTIDFSTRSHPVFNYYYNLFYKNGIKFVTPEILKNITPRGLAFWICNDGSYCKKQSYIILCTNSLSLEEHKLMKNFFKEKFGIYPRIGYRDGKYYYLRFSKDDSKKLIEIVKPFIPKSMKYKIGEHNDR